MKQREYAFSSTFMGVYNVYTVYIDRRSGMKPAGMDD